MRFLAAVCLVIVSAVVAYSTYVFLPHYLGTLLSYFNQSVGTDSDGQTKSIRDL